MGYKKFDGNEEDIMRVMQREKKVKKDALIKDYPQHIKSLLRKKMIKSIGEFYIITDRGNSAITQQLRDGEYWVSPLKPKQWNPYGKVRISRELRDYIK